MTVLNQTNTIRVQKINELIGHIIKSAESNNATQEELWQLMSPAVDAIQGMLDPEAKPDSPASPAPDFSNLTAGQRAAMILADQASLRELIASLHGRLGVHLDLLTKED